MPCSWPLRRCRKDEAEARLDDNGVEMQSWQHVRRQNVRKLRKCTKNIILAMALFEMVKVGPGEMVYAGTRGFAAPNEEAYGIAYTVGRFLSWIVLCLVALIFVPFFSWWLPSSTPSEDPAHPDFLQRLTYRLQRFDMVLLPCMVGMYLVEHVYYLVQAFIYVDARSADKKTWPANTRNNWLVRILLLTSITTSIVAGYGALYILAHLDLARVKFVEYCVIVIPVQVNMGIVLGSVLQHKIEQRSRLQEFKARLAKAAEEGTVDEKQLLI